MPVSDRQGKGDVIYRQDAISVLGAQCKDEYDKTCGKDCECMEYMALRDMPSAQKKGHWVKNHDSDHAWKCSECGCGYTDSKLSFCYDCGADMRGDANEDT